MGIKDAVGTNTLRKTLGFLACQQGADITRIQQMLNHSSQGIPLRYIGRTKDELDSVYIYVNV